MNSKKEYHRPNLEVFELESMNPLAASFDTMMDDEEVITNIYEIL